MSRRRAAPALTLLVAALVAGPALGGSATPGSLSAETRSTAGTPAALPAEVRPPVAPAAPAVPPSVQRRAEAARRPSLTLQPLLGQRQRPNIVVLMLDDMRDDDLRFMPRTRRLIEQRGVRFRNGFSPHPLCCPARASFLSGRYTHNHGVWGNRPPYGFAVFDDRRTLPVWLHRLGYSTTYLGKYLNGYGYRDRADGSSSVRYVPPGWTDWRGAVDKLDGAEPHLRGTAYNYFFTTLSENGRLVSYRYRYQTHVLSRLAQEAIRGQARSPRPFFVTVSFVAPHDGGPRERRDPVPVVRSDGQEEGFGTPASPRYVHGRFDAEIRRLPAAAADPTTRGKPYFIRALPRMAEVEVESDLRRYRQRAESLAVVDEEVGNLVATLRRTGELDHTYVMLTSDNGYFLGEHRLRKGKILPYEPSLRVPFLLRGPGIPAGETRTDPFLTTDIAPTLVEAAGGTPDPGIDGVSMLDVARNGDRGWTRAVLTETGPRPLLKDELAVLGDGFRFLDRPNGPSLVRFTQGVRTPRWLYVEHASRERELYDVLADPDQQRNLVDDPAYRRFVELLAAELDRLRTCAGATCAHPMPPALRAPRGAGPDRAAGLTPGVSFRHFG